MSLEDLRKEFNINGWTILNEDFQKEVITKLKKLFLNKFKLNFSDEPSYNRELIKRFANHPLCISFFCDSNLINKLEFITNTKTAVNCGPLVSHYTSNDITGNSYGLPFHQDFPSMAGSINSFIVWVNLVDSNIETHGIEIISGEHKNGILPGIQTERGYILNDFINNKSKIIPEINAGSILIMSSFTPHRTFVNEKYIGWKLSLSQRFDDLEEESWKSRMLKNAYDTTVDRELYLKCKI